MGTIGLNVPIIATGAQQGAAAVNAALNSMAASADSALGKIGSLVDSVEGNFLTLQNTILGFALGGFVRDIVEAETSFQRINNTLIAATGSAAMATIQYDELRDTVNRLALDLPTTAQQFAQMSAAAIGTSLEGAKVKQIFEGVATAVSALALPAEKAHNVLYAVQQMMSEGIVSMKELRRQLGDNLPGAFNVAAQAMGVTTAQMVKLVKSGQLLSSEFLPKFADLLEKRYGAAALRAANLTQGLINKLNTAAFEFKNFLAQSGFGAALDDAIRRLTALLKSDTLKQAATVLGEDLGKAISGLVTVFGFLANHAREVLTIFEVFIGTKVALYFAGIAVQVANLTKELIGLRAVQSTLGLLGGGSAPAAINTSQYYTRAGKLLTPQQFALKANAFSGVNAQEYQALQFLTGNGGQVLNQTALNARLASNAYSQLNTEAKVMIQTLGAQLGLQAVVSQSWIQALKGMGASAAAAASNFGNLAKSAAAAAGGFAQAGLDAIAALPGWFKILGVLILIAGALYAARDVQISYGADTVRLGSLMRESWVLVASSAKDAWDSIKSGSKTAYEYFKEKFNETLLVQSFKFVANYLNITWVDDFKRAIDTAYNYWKSKLTPSILAEFTKNVDNTNAIGGQQGTFDPITGVKIAAPNPAAAIIAKQLATFKPRVKTDPEREPADSLLKFEARVKKTIDVLKAQGIAYNEQIAINSDYDLSNGQVALSLASIEAKRKAEDAILNFTLNTKYKLSAAQRQEIIDNEKNNALLKITAEAQAKYRTELVNTNIQIDQQKQINAAVFLGAEAVERINEAYAAANVQRAFGNILSQAEIKNLQDKIVLLEHEKFLNGLLQQAKALNDNVNALKVYNDALQNLNLIYSTGALTTSAYKKALQDLADKYDDQINSILSSSKKGSDGVTLFFREYAKAAQTTAQTVHDAFKASYDELNKDLVNFLDTGKFKFSDFLSAVRHQINQIIVDKVFGNFFKVLLGDSAPLNPGQSPKGGSYSAGILSTFFGLGNLYPATTPGFNPNAKDDPTKQITQNFKTAAQQTAQNFGVMIQTVGGQFGQLLSGLAGIFTNILNSVSGGGWAKLIGGIAGIFGHGAAAAGGVSSSTSTTITGIADGFADGGVMTRFGRIPLRSYSGGGITNGPQLSLFGEGRRPEAYVPLPDGRSIPVTMNSQTAAQPLNVRVLVVNKSQQPVNAQQSSSKYDTTMREAVVQVILTDQIENGATRRAGIGR